MSIGYAFVAMVSGIPLYCECGVCDVYMTKSSSFFRFCTDYCVFYLLWQVMTGVATKLSTYAWWLANIAVPIGELVFCDALDLWYMWRPERFCYKFLCGELLLKFWPFGL